MADAPDAVVPPAPVPGNDVQTWPTSCPRCTTRLRELARRRMAQENPGNTLQATALVHEVFLRMERQGTQRFATRGQFFAVAGEAMRRILIEHARAKGCLKRGGAAQRLPMNVLDLALAPDTAQILSLNEAFERLAQESPDVAAIVRLRFFAGLSVEETAAATGLSARTINREWKYARAWLYRALQTQR